LIEAWEVDEEFDMANEVFISKENYKLGDVVREKSSGKTRLKLVFAG
jgi:hypothetical protein